MKKVLLIVTVLLLATLALFACSNSENKSFGSNDVSYPEVKGTLGEFHAEAPSVHFVTLDVPTFSWTPCENAETYELEIASTSDFDEDDVSYLKKIGITDTDATDSVVEYTIGAALKSKDTTYYWRVTAVNGSKKKVFSEGLMDFYYKANVQEQIEMDVIHTDEWQRHKAGSNATLAVDKKDFFGTGKDSLVISFVEEDTNIGDEDHKDSDGWVVYTHSEEIELYGVNAFYFNFYYAGDDADIYFRVVDEDNEYWKAPIKLANNAKQTIIIHKDEFVLHTKDTTIANQKFDFQNLKSFEIVFEHSFGDGIAYFSDLRVITYEKYDPLFVTNLDFNKYKDGFSGENYVFDTEVSEDGKSLTYAFSGVANEKNDKGIQGYGFVKMPVTTTQDVQDALDVNVKCVILGRGDAFRMKIVLNDDHLSGSHKICIRLVEEDGDRWSYQQSVGTLPADGVLIIPFNAFTMSEFGGDGFRQFYGVKEFQFGVTDNVYTSSRITISDVSVVTIATVLADESNPLYHSNVREDGMIEDFENYKNSLDMYYTWSMSTSNKDEAMAIDDKNGVGVNNTVGMFYYKTNMDEAVYTVNIDPIKDNPYNAIEIWAKDFSIARVQMDNGSWRDVTINADMVIYLSTDTGSMYRFTINEISKEWRYYKILFSDFKRMPKSTGTATIDPNKIVKISIAFSDIVTSFGAGSDKNYVTGSAVALDSIRFTTATGSVTDSLVKKIEPSADDANVAVIDNFDDGVLRWAPKAGQEKYVKSVLTYEETASGTGYSLALAYKTGMEDKYFTSFDLDGSVHAQGIRFLMKATQASGFMPQVTFVIYLENGEKYQCDLRDDEGKKTSLTSEWTYYTIGFDHFTLDNAGVTKLSTDDVPNISQIFLVFKNYTDTAYRTGTVYIDEIVLDNTIPLGQNERATYTK